MSFWGERRGDGWGFVYIRSSWFMLWSCLNWPFGLVKDFVIKPERSKFLYQK